MAIKRIVSNIQAFDLTLAQKFYARLSRHGFSHGSWVDQNLC